MAPSSSAAHSRGAAQQLPAFRRTEAPRQRSRPKRKYKSLVEIMKIAKHAVVDQDDYSHVMCEQCGSGELGDELLLCDKCDKALHMHCVRPVAVRVPIGPWYCPSCCSDQRGPLKKFSQSKIKDFFRLQKCNDVSVKRISPQDARKRRRRGGPLVYPKKPRRLLPFIPTEDPARRYEQMGSLAHALSDLKLEFSNDLTYMPGMAPRSANQAEFESGGMQVLTKEDKETLEHCRDMYRIGKCPPLKVVSNPLEGYTVEVDGPIRHMTFITEYAGDVDYINNREHDDCDSLMTLLLANNPSESLVICPDKRGNIARFINGINNHTPEGKKKPNLKCVRYNVNGECRVFLVASRDIARGERLYYDYNGYEHAYPTKHFV